MAHKRRNFFAKPNDMRGAIDFVFTKSPKFKSSANSKCNRVLVLLLSIIRHANATH
jgi:hypothetical protein